jgi:hypothetical protein
MKIKQKPFFAVISMILLSATALGVPADNTNTKNMALHYFEWVTPFIAFQTWCFSLWTDNCPNN